MMQLLGLGLFAGSALNVLLQFGMGFRTLVAVQSSGLRAATVPTLSIFSSGALVWAFFAYLLAPLSLGLLEPLLLYPAVVILCMLIKMGLCSRCSPQVLEDEGQGLYTDSGASLVAAFLVLRLAARFLEALFLSAGIALGYFAALWILTEIRRRSSGESVPRFLKGAPLVLVSAGLLSLISFAVSAVLATAIGLD